MVPGALAHGTTLPADVLGGSLGATGVGGYSLGVGGAEAGTLALARPRLGDAVALVAVATGAVFVFPDNDDKGRVGRWMITEEQSM